jgi:hypothetical protein
MQSENDRALLNLQRRLERQFFEGCRLDPEAKRWVVQVYESVTHVVGSGVAVSAAFDVIAALNAGTFLCEYLPSVILLTFLQIFKSR